MSLIASIKTIAFFPASYLTPGLRYDRLSFSKVTAVAPASPLTHHGKARLKSESKTSEALTAQTELTFSTSDLIPAYQPLAFIATDHQGNSWLIGAFEPPFPIVTSTMDTGSAPADRYITDITVSWPFPPMPVTLIAP